MAQILSISIDLSKFDKARIIKGKTTGQYYNLQVFVNDEKDKYGNDIAVAEGQTKEERDRKDKKKYLGNGRKRWESTSNKPKPTAEGSETITSEYDDSLPF